MRVTEIKGTVPGTSKTTALVKLFLTAKLPNKVLLCLTHSSRQVCIEKAINFGMDPEEAEKSIKTLRKFKGNYSKVTRGMVTSKHSTPHYGKIWNIFIDEAPMITKVEMDDLVNNWRINNLVLCGDSLQFGPLGCKEGFKSGKEFICLWHDEGLPYDLNISKQFLLNKPLRSVDPKLTKAINLVKEGKIVEAITLICDGKDMSELRCEYKDTDWHIACTYRYRELFNKKYENPRRFVVTLDDHKYKFCRSEILDIDDKRFTILKGRLPEIDYGGEVTLSFEGWKKMHLAPAYAVTYHKLQGVTVSEGKVYIHLDDILYGLQGIKSDEGRAKEFQKLLYVAISRATKAKQFEFYNGGKDVFDELKHLESLMKPMVDDSILKDAIEMSGDDENLNQLLEDALEYDVSTVEDVPEEYKEMISKAHSGLRKWTDEKLKSYGDDAIGLRNDLSRCDKSRREEILTRYTKLTGVVVPKETEEERKERISKAHSKPRKNGWTDEKLLSYESVASLVNALSACGCDKSRREKLLTRYAELRGVVIPKETEEERKERISKAHSKPRKNGWTDERIMSYTDKKELKRDIRKLKKHIRERVLARWLELHNK